ncbi:MAG: SpoVG family protein [Candidatus Riflebacteria bacterium]|nr:SpoVG family protein [Candidatus Riflebacteria bacterium]
MKVTDIRIQIIKDPKNKLKAFSTVILDDSLVLRDIRIFESERGDFISMPSVKGPDGNWHEVVTLINTDLKNQISGYVLRAYHDELLKKI